MMSMKQYIILCLLFWTIVCMLCARDAGMHFKYSVFDWRKCETVNREFLMFRNIPIQKCLFECRIRNACNAVKFLTIRRECGLLETAVNMATEYNTRPCVFIQMADVEDIIPMPSICQNCSMEESCDIETDSCVIRENCGLKWFRIDQSCYHLTRDLKIANEANVYCSSKHAHLVYIETEKENSYIERLLNNTAAWIGITDAGVEGVWKFSSTNLNATFTAWSKGQPDNFLTEEHCASIGQFAGWNDYKCSNKLAIICEKSLKMIEA